MIADGDLAIREALGDYWRLMKQAGEFIYSFRQEKDSYVGCR